MRLYYAIVFSIIAHLLFYQGMSKYASHIETVGTEKVEVILLEDGKDLLVVRNPETPKPDLEAPSDTNLLSEKNQVFKRQQRAAIIDKTVNRSAKKQAEQTLQKQFEDKMKDMSELDKALVARVRRAQDVDNFQSPTGALNPNFQQAPMPSTINDPLTNIPIGSFTALNTNRYLFYSFYSRIEDQIRFHWVEKVRESIQRRPRIPPGERSREVWVTELEIVLDRKGHFVKADVARSSGIDAFDYAAIDAFREGAPIPNPPEDLIEVDGLIHIQYAFNVHWKTNY
jgi:TonB family protein